MVRITLKSLTLETFCSTLLAATTRSFSMEMSIKVINELRLDLGDPMGQKAYDDHMRDFLSVPASFYDDEADAG